MQHSFRKMARLRMSHLCDFKGAILHKMDGYFRPLFPFLTNLLNTFFPEHPSTDNDYDNRMTSSTMIDLFNDEYNKLADLKLENKSWCIKYKRDGGTTIEPETWWVMRDFGAGCKREYVRVLRLIGK